MFENVRFYAEMPILGLERCDILKIRMIWTACDAGLIDGERRIPACHAGEY